MSLRERKPKSLNVHVAERLLPGFTRAYAGGAIGAGAFLIMDPKWVDELAKMRQGFETGFGTAESRLDALKLIASSGCALWRHIRRGAGTTTRRPRCGPAVLGRAGVPVRATC